MTGRLVFTQALKPRPSEAPSYDGDFRHQVPGNGPATLCSFGSHSVGVKYAMWGGRKASYQVSIFQFRMPGFQSMRPLYIARSREIASRQLGDEMIVMSTRESTLFSLDNVGLVIWQAADGRTPLEEIVKEKVCAEFQVTQEEALKDAESFVRELAGHGILILSDSPIEDEGSRQ
jgi:hypothetical protein